MSILKNAILIILVIASIQGLILKPSENYTNHVELADNYDLYWKNDQEKITFELHFTSKWALFGISDESYADFITGWLTPDLKGHFNDHYGNLSKFESFVDNEANWLPILANRQENENTTILKFSRYVKLCDETRHDLDIEKGQMNVVFATGDEFLDEKHIKYNKTQIGNLKVALIDSENEFSCGNLIKDQSTFGSKPTDTYQNFVDFIPSVYRLYWNITKTDGKNSSDMIGEIHCKTDGWVGFGLSPNGGMDSSDVVIAWSRNGSANFTVRIKRFFTLLTQKLIFIVFYLGSIYSKKGCFH